MLCLETRLQYYQFAFTTCLVWVFVLCRNSKLVNSHMKCTRFRITWCQLLLLKLKLHNWNFHFMILGKHISSNQTSTQGYLMLDIVVKGSRFWMRLSLLRFCHHSIILKYIFLCVCVWTRWGEVIFSGQKIWALKECGGVIVSIRLPFFVLKESWLYLWLIGSMLKGSPIYDTLF